MTTRPATVAAILAALVMAHTAAAQPAPSPREAPAVPAKPEALPPLSKPTPNGNPLPGMDSLGGVEPDQIPDVEAAVVDGFNEVILAERLNDPRTASIRKEFVKGIEAAVGQDGTHPFEWALLDLNGDGYNDLVIVPRALGVRDKPGFDGMRVVVYCFNGTSWNLALDSGAMEVYSKVVPHDDEPNQYQLAMVQEQGYVLYEWNGKVFARAPTVDTSRWPRREETSTNEPSLPETVEGTGR